MTFSTRGSPEPSVTLAVLVMSLYLDDLSPQALGSLGFLGHPSSQH